MTEDKIKLSHGAGGRLSQDLFNEIIYPSFKNEALSLMHDGAKLNISGKIAFSTDSYVVRPLFFAGGDIGKLAVCGTVNDLAMTGAIPRFLSCGVVIEEGFPVGDLKKIVQSMREAAEEAGVHIVTGDTKVVERGKADGIFINTAGIGELIDGVDIDPRNVKAGMKVVLSGYIGDHAATVLASRHGLELPPEIKSDCAPLSSLICDMLKAAPDIAVLRDPTRGGVAAVLNEIASSSKVSILLDETAVPLRDEVKGFTEMLGFDPLQLANEGKVVAFVPADKADILIDVMRKHKYGENACVIGEVTNESAGQVAIETALGGIRIVDMPLGEIVPRIC